MSILPHVRHRSEDALSFRAAVADNGSPIAIRLLLRIRRNLEGERLVVRQLRPVIEARSRKTAAARPPISNKRCLVWQP